MLLLYYKLINTNEVFKINKYVVKPLNSKKENLSLILIFISVIVFAGLSLTIRHRADYTQEIKANEISAFQDLNNIELSIYSDLLNSSTEIYIMKEEKNIFPDINTLHEEQIAPFYKDRTWKEKGAIEWFSFQHDDEQFYIGFSNDEKIGNFLLSLNKNDIVNIYYTKEKFPKENIEQKFSKYEDLFKKVIPYTGEDERKKFKEE